MYLISINNIIISCVLFHKAHIHICGGGERDMRATNIHGIQPRLRVHHWEGFKWD